MKEITRFPLAHFEECAPVLLKCFPDFWQARFARGERSFPYDLKLFTMKIQRQIIGTVGIHDYQFIIPCRNDGDVVISAVGVCDLGVVPEMRGRGYAGEMQDFVLEYVSHHRLVGVIPLYTDKPAVYIKRGWFIYQPDNAQEIRTGDFPMDHAFRIDAGKLRPCFLSFKDDRPVNPEEAVFRKIQSIYHAGKSFPGKVMRSAKTWLELFSDPHYQWILEKESYFLYSGERLIEGYSADPSHPVNKFTPVNGGYDHNCIMINVLHGDKSVPDALLEHVARRTLQFPIADIF